jgi:hypothetical protein
MASEEIKKQVEVQAKALPPASLDTLKQLRKDNCDAKDFHLASFQLFLRRLLSPDSPTRCMLLVHGTGVGKCHGIDTPILMYDGSVKMVQDIVVNDVLMGDDSTPRRVMTLARGIDELYTIRSTKGDSYVVNQEHILCLKQTGQNEVTEITVTDFLKKSKKIQGNLKGYSTGVEFETKPVDFDPYVLGVWLGDGSKRDPVISCQDSKILSYLRTFGKENGLSLNFQGGYDYRLSADSPKGPNMFLSFLQSNDLINNKHVPVHFKINSRDIRLRVLAGLIDTDGYLSNNCYEITQKSKVLADDIIFLARSLGFTTTTKLVQKSCIYKGERRIGQYYRTNIIGDIANIPVKILRKQGNIRKINKDPLKYGIQVIPKGLGDYYGFTLDGNNRYVLGNFTVTHNTCTAIQVAEEYILRPEFQDKKVLVLASTAVQENFRTQIFDVSRVKQDPAGLLLSQQCTGRRYLDQLERAQTEGLRWENPENREKLNTIVQKMIDDFYDFSGGIQFANFVDKKKTNLSPADFKAWVHETFDGKLLIVDEAHSLREDDTKDNKLQSESIQQIAQIAEGMTLVFLTATPMYNTFQEIMIFFNIFLWNDKRQKPSERMTANSIFNGDGTFKTADTEATFRGWVHEYVSFIRGENPFTFPFRLPPPPEMIAPLDRETDVNGKAIKEPRKYLPLVVSYVEGAQKVAVSSVTGKLQEDFIPTIVASPDGRSITKCFEKPRDSSKYQYRYVKDVVPFLSPSNVRNHAAKFATILNCIQQSSGIVFVFSNFVRGGALQFAMCLEEHGFDPAIGTRLLENPSGEHEGSSQGKYAFLTSDMGERQVTQLIRRLRKSENANGSDIRVIIGSPLISEGVDFKNVRQVHILDPWYNMSRIEQIIGRGLRTCSHSGLPFEDQNCTVYLHIVRYADSKKETYDEYAYRVYVEAKTAGIAKVKRVLAESAVDCTTQIATNQLPDEWRSLIIPQKRAQDRKIVSMPLSALSAPTFEDGTPALVCYIHTSPSDAEPYVRPLSSYLDIRDEIFDTIVNLFEKKELWRQEDLLEQLKYAPEVSTYLVESAIREHLKLKDSNGRIGTLENRGGVYAFKPRDIPDGTMFERSVADAADIRTPIDVPEEELPPPAPEKPKGTIESLRESYRFPFIVRRFPQNIIDWFLVDQVMEPAEKRDLILTRQEPPPPYAEGLRIDGLNYLVFGPKDIVNDKNEPVEPIGTELDAYKAWANGHLDRIVEQIKEGKIMCTQEKQSLKIAPFIVNEEGHIQRAPREKTVRPKECGFYHIPELKAFARDVTGDEFPAEAKKKEPQCIYLSLAARTANERIFWVQPEIWAVLSSAEFAGKILSRLKASKTDRE